MLFRMDSQTTKRAWMAFLVAPLVAPVLFQTALIIFEYDAIPSVSGLVKKAFLPLLAIALPISYGAILLIGLPLISFLRKIGYLNFYSLTTSAALVGTTIMWVIYGSITLSDDGWKIVLWYPIAGSILGFSVAAVCYVISGVSKRENRITK